MASDFPYFQFYVKDFAGDGKVEAMTTCEVGAYILLLCKAWHETPPATIPADDRVLARWTRLNPAEWAECREAVLSCFRDCGDGRLINTRMRKEYDRLRGKSKKAAAAAAERWQCERIADAMPRTYESGSDSESSDGDRIADVFNRFWQLWPKRVAKADARRAWAKACGKVHPTELLAAVAEFAATPMGKSGRYCPHPATWLNDERWSDDRATWWSYETTPEDGRKQRQNWLDKRAALEWWQALTDDARQHWIKANAAWFPRRFETDAVNRNAWAEIHARQQWDKLATWAWRESRKGEAA
jgi:uncharacterized protein YdaU (DUF1376 family)